MSQEPLDRPYAATRKQLIILGLFPLSEAIAWSTVFPYIYSMVQSFSSSESQSKNSAIYAGIMVSGFTFGESIMAPQWAKISDRIGRKPTLLIGSLGAMFAAFLFGVSKTLPWAIAARICAGLLNPNLGVIQTFVGELVRREEQAKGFSVVPFLRSIGTIIGPVIGGYLAEPSKQYPSVFDENSIWHRYPFLLPNLVVVVFLFCSGMIGLFCLEEVHPNFRAHRDFGILLRKAISDILQGRLRDDRSVRYFAIDADEPPVELMGASEAVQAPANITSNPPAFSKQVMLQILSNAILGFLKIATLAMVPIFLATPPEIQAPQELITNLERGILKIAGGFGFDTASISNVLLSQAIATVISQMFAIPAIIARFGALHSYRMIIMLLTFVFLLMPFAASIPNWAGIPAIVVLLWVYALANGLATTSSAILITNTAPSPVHLAKINGASASLGCLARTLGPAVSGPLFRLGLQTGYIGLAFWVMSAVSGLGVMVSFFLRNHP